MRRAGRRRTCAATDRGESTPGAFDGQPGLEAGALEELAWYARLDGRIEDSLSLLTEALRIERDLGDIQHVLDSLSRFARSHVEVGRSELAARLLSCSLAEHGEFALKVPLYQVKRNEETLTLIRQQLDEEAFAEAWEQGRALTLDEAVALALASLD